jgi:hypothetical protein
MKAMITIASIGIGLLSAQANASTQNLRAGQVYMGKEAVNEHLTGNNCFITIQRVEPFLEKGLHCHSAEFLFATVREDVPKGTLRVDSRVTNYHRPEFPKVRTCAMNVNGTTSGDEIYGDDTSVLYNQIFGGSMKEGGTQYDYFLTLAPDTREAVRARVHIQETLTERDVDCVRLKKM